MLNLEKLNVGFAGKKAGVLSRGFHTVLRAKVPGGWLVMASGGQGLSGVTFYPDPEHRWDGGSQD